MLCLKFVLLLTMTLFLYMSDSIEHPNFGAPFADGEAKSGMSFLDLNSKLSSNNVINPSHLGSTNSQTFPRPYTKRFFFGFFYSLY